MCSDGSQLAQAQGTVISGVEVSSVLDGVDGWSFGQEGFSLHDKWVRSKFLTVLSCQLFYIVYISVSCLMSGASNSTPVLFEDCRIWHVTMVTKNEVLFLNFCLRILLGQVPSE